MAQDINRENQKPEFVPPRPEDLSWDGHKVIYIGVAIAVVAIVLKLTGALGLIGL
ncbi:MAG: hypothetical protein R3C03_05555 [Pirellulaceae bacterium]